MTVSIMMVLSWVLALSGFIGWRNMLSPSSWLMRQDWEVEDFYRIRGTKAEGREPEKGYEKRMQMTRFSTLSTYL
jgi:hypothetical protein